MIHLYCGDGKGKTTCAFGLALRAAGRDMGVVVAQFLKTEDSGERLALQALPQVTLLPLPQRLPFLFQMTPQERRDAGDFACRLLAQAEERARAGACGMVVLDECCAAVTAGLLPLEDVTAFLDRWGDSLEVVLTGRDPHPDLLARADYITEMRKLAHPYDHGVPARKGIEW